MLFRSDAEELSKQTDEKIAKILADAKEEADRDITPILEEGKATAEAVTLSGEKNIDKAAEFIVERTLENGNC